MLQAADKDSPAHQEALTQLLKDNWFPLFTYLRRSGRSAEEAEDLIQGFCTRLIEKGLLSGIEGKHRGRFRSYLLVCLKNYVTDEWKKSVALKRGGKDRPVSIDAAEADRRYLVEPSHELTPERAFDRAWAVEMVQRSLASLKASWKKSDKAKQFAALKNYLLPDDQVPSYAETAEQLEMNLDTLKVTIHRLRAEFRKTLCTHVSETLGRHDLLEDEINHLFSALCS
ncbi:MAG: sigma-70 family RNA polymerase sigma factor [Planctomycetota bacterium]